MPGFGRTCAEEMAKKLDGKGDILIMEGIPCEVNTLRVNAFREVMKKYPGIRILESQASYWSTEKGLKLMENFLQKYPKIDAVWAGDDDVLLGALKAYEESGRKDIRLMIRRRRFQGDREESSGQGPAGSVQCDLSAAHDCLRRRIRCRPAQRQARNAGETGHGSRRCDYSEKRKILLLSQFDLLKVCPYLPLEIWI